MLDVAIDAMAAEQAEHERVQVQVQVRARMPLLPRRCRVLAGDSDYRVLHGVDVLLGHRVPKGVDVLGHCVKRGVRAARPPREEGLCRALLSRRFVVASVGGSDAYRAEAEPFTAKRSGTG